MNNKVSIFPTERNVQLKKRVMEALWGIYKVLQKHTHTHTLREYIHMYHRTSAP